MTDWKKIRAILFAAAGGYIAYTAYTLFTERTQDTVMPLWMIYLFSALFALAGAAIIVYSCILWKRAKAEEEAVNRQIAAEEDTARQSTENGSETGKAPGDRENS